MKLEEINARYLGAETFKFGDNRELCDELLVLVRAGKKTATCGALRDYNGEGEKLPVVGRCDIALNWDGDPALVIETIEVTIRRFCDVGEDFALAEGEDESLEGWQTGHRAYFAQWWFSSRYETRLRTFQVSGRFWLAALSTRQAPPLHSDVGPPYFGL